MAVSREDVLRVASLARLRLSSDEVQRFTTQLNAILEHVAELEKVDAARSIEPGLDESAAAPLRPDVPGPDRLHRPPASFAPAWAEGFFIVPRLSALDGDAEGVAES